MQINIDDYDLNPREKQHLKNILYFICTIHKGRGQYKKTSFKSIQNARDYALSVKKPCMIYAVCRPHDKIGDAISVFIEGCKNGEIKPVKLYKKPTKKTV